ncbi:hypothetical protein KR084_012541, partial [Drosophila pseudotakahashii]
PSAYQPLCMLNTTGKLLEKMIKPRLSAAVNRAGGLSPRQFDFRPGRSTIGAIQKVYCEALRSQQGNFYSRPKLLYQTKAGEKCVNLTSGAAQGLILGPELWNISYDEILRIEMPKDTTLVGYADDIVAVISARSPENVLRKLNQVMLRVKGWTDNNGFLLATEKTELLLVTT